VCCCFRGVECQYECSGLVGGVGSSDDGDGVLYNVTILSPFLLARLPVYKTLQQHTCTMYTRIYTREGERERFPHILFMTEFTQRKQREEKKKISTIETFLKS